MEAFGDWIRARREKMGLSQTELAKRIRVTQSSVSHYEHGKRVPRRELLPLLRALGATDAEVLRLLELTSAASTSAA